MSKELISCCRRLGLIHDFCRCGKFAFSFSTKTILDCSLAPKGSSRSPFTIYSTRAVIDRGIPQHYKSYKRQFCLDNSELSRSMSFLIYSPCTLSLIVVCSRNVRKIRPPLRFLKNVGQQCVVFLFSKDFSIIGAYTLIRYGVEVHSARKWGHTFVTKVSRFVCYTQLRNSKV